MIKKLDYIEQLRSQTIDELKLEVEKIRGALEKEQIEEGLSPSADVHQKGKLRKNLARAMTILNEKLTQPNRSSKEVQT